MGRYMSGGSRTLRLVFKLRYLLLRIRRNYSHLAKTSKTTKTAGLSLDVQSCRPPSHRRTILETSGLHVSSCGSTTEQLHRGFTVKDIHQTIRFYSTSKTDPLESQADPVGVFQDPQTRSLGARLGQTLDRLSRHLDVCYTRKDASWVVCMAGGDDGGLVSAPEYLSRRGRTGRETARQRRLTEDRQETKTPKPEHEQDSPRPSNTSSPPDMRTASPPSGLQLFHISSLATRFGESFSYVSHHINSAFSGDPRGDDVPAGQEALVEPPVITPVTMATNTSQRRKKAPRHNVQNSRSLLKSNASPVTEVSSSSSSWEDSYQYLAGHINRYFGAKVTDECDHQRLPQKVHFAAESSGADPKASKPSTSSSQPRQEEPSTSRTQRVPSSQPRREEPSTSRTQRVPSSQPRRGEEVPGGPQTAGLFHSSSYAARFGESYTQMAAHVNRYFKGRGSLEEEWDGNDLGGMVAGPAAAAAAAAVDEVKAMSFMDALLQPSVSIPSLLAGLLNVAPPWGRVKSRPSDQPEDTSSNENKLKRRVAMGMRQAELTTHGLIDSVGGAFSPDDLTVCIQALNQHLLHYPACRAVLWQDKTAVKLLRHRRRHKDNQEVQEVIRESLALIGYVDPVRGRGIRVLSIDGGGTRGVVPLQVLKHLETETGRPIHQLFDYICGVSTGAVLGFMVGVARFSLEGCGQMYRRFGSDVFRQNPLLGTVNMGWSHSYYSTETWERILRETLGEKLLLSTVRDELSPKVSAVSAVVNWGTSPKPFVFRNYNHTPGSLSRYAGGSHYKMWEAVRASSAAPGYFQEFRLQSDIHQDGGILLNNPCALAVHEARLLWPNQPFQCVVSLGTGRYDNAKRNPATSTSLRAKLSTLVCSATDTEGVHTLLDDLLAPDVYFRFNPMLSSEVSLDESRPQALDGLLGDTGAYLDRNRHKLARLCLVLGPERSAAQTTNDWMRQRAWEIRQRWL